ncbi:hypothetical protein [Actinomadura sp. 21ATH]|uniref:hypothetical protein n=1 Tax=Actinomadura sp. 21ATH TaxID=1735444 RepID=UPI0035BFFB70
MGYVRSRYLRFVFDETTDPALAGLEMRTQRLSSETVLELVQLKEAREDGVTDRDIIERPFEILADVLVSWNLQEEDDEGNAVDVEPTRDALLCDLPWATKLLKAWMRAVNGISNDLGKDSPSGETSVPEPSLPMEPLSPSPQSSLVPS